jgi:hypothetical protein
MKPMHQLEAANLMISAANFTAGYTRALLAATRPTDRPSQAVHRYSQYILHNQLYILCFSSDSSNLRA